MRLRYRIAEEFHEDEEDWHGRFTVFQSGTRYYVAIFGRACFLEFEGPAALEDVQPEDLPVGRVAERLRMTPVMEAELSDHWFQPILEQMDPEGVAHLLKGLGAWIQVEEFGEDGCTAELHMDEKGRIRVTSGPAELTRVWKEALGDGIPGRTESLQRIDGRIVTRAVLLPNHTDLVEVLEEHLRRWGYRVVSVRWLTTFPEEFISENHIELLRRWRE